LVEINCLNIVIAFITIIEGKPIYTYMKFYVFVMKAFYIIV